MSVRYQELAVGQIAVLTRTVSEADVVAYAELTGDKNPAHLDQAWAERSRFGGRVAHGMLTAGFISAAMGMQVPGPGTIYLQQTLRFTAPVRIGDTVTVRAEVVELIAAKRRVRLKTTVVNQRGEPVLDGEALVMMADENV
ncbi:MAG: MaoC family dehydratase [Gemmatimonadota bacterium]|nr:MaoC family dehydratase [Gemmatimonadota bacterium]